MIMKTETENEIKQEEKPIDGLDFNRSPIISELLKQLEIQQ